MKTMRLFKAALTRMLDEGEFERAAWPNLRKARRTGKVLAIMREQLGGLEGVPPVALMSLIDDPDVFKDALVYMATIEAEEAGE